MLNEINKKEKIKFTFLVDKLNYLASLYLYIIIFVGVTSFQLVGKPIVCWTPADFTLQMVEFTSQFCWSNAKFNKNSQNMLFYKWTPFYILCSYFFYYFPKLIWLDYLRKNGLYNLIIDIKVNELKNISVAKKYFEKKDFSSKGFNFKTRIISLNYLLLKLLFLSNSILQFYALHNFLNYKFFFLGIDYIKSAFWKENKIIIQFPRIGVCNVTVTQLGYNRHSYLVECLLPINEIYDKIYVALWFWLIVLTFVNLISFVQMFFRCFIYSSHLYNRFIRRKDPSIPDIELIDELFFINRLSFNFYECFKLVFK